MDQNEVKEKKSSVFLPYFIDVTLFILCFGLLLDGIYLLGNLTISASTSISNVNDNTLGFVSYYLHVVLEAILGSLFVLYFLKHLKETNNGFNMTFVVLFNLFYLFNVMFFIFLLCFPMFSLHFIIEIIALVLILALDIYLTVRYVKSLR